MITFVGFSKRSSGIIRGKQISNVIKGSDFVDVDFPTIPKNPITIHVRKFNEQYAKYCKSKNIKVGFDVADNPVTDYLYGRIDRDDLSTYVNPLCDFYIVNNDVVKQQLSLHTDKNIYVIPHHNCNFLKKTKKKNKLTKVGYVGVPEYSIKEDYISDFCRKQGIEFINKNPQTHEELQPVFEEIDIGIVFFEKTSIKEGIYERVIKYKPNVKLTNFQSFGIPTICLPYESYKQFGENQCIFIESFEELKHSIINLVKDDSLYDLLSNQSIAVGEKYHISKIAKYYEKIVDTLTL